MEYLGEEFVGDGLFVGVYIDDVDVVFDGNGGGTFWFFVLFGNGGVVFWVLELVCCWKDWVRNDDGVVVVWVFDVFDVDWNWRFGVDDLVYG